MRLLACFALFLWGAATLGSDAFAPLARSPRTASSRLAPLWATTLDTKASEAKLRQEIAQRNSLVEREEQYSVLDGERLTVGLEAETVTVSSLTAGAAATMTDGKSLSAEMERLTRTRPYPLFLAEKAVELVESAVEDLQKAFQSSSVDDASTTTTGSRLREKVVILGTGWGAASFLKAIDTDLYDVTVISPRNYFLFTPMLAGACVGTVEYRSITQPVREINRKVNFLEATATGIDVDTKTVTCSSIICESSNLCQIEDFTVPYDKLLVTIGAQPNTFGIPGVREHCHYLKQIEDARQIRRSIVECFERANLPGLSKEERRNNLTFCVIGAGPTGIEFAAELRDFVEQDGPKYYPNLLKDVRIKVIEASSTILAPFDQSLREEAILQMERKVVVKDDAVLKLLPPRFKLVELLLGSSVKEVKENTIDLNDGTSMNYGLAVWAAGNGPLPLTLQLIDSLGEEQKKKQEMARGRISTDPWLRAIGGKGSILALGDCSCACNHNNMLPATAQVAAQQGEYLAKVMNKQYNLSPSPTTTMSNKDEDKEKEGMVLPPPTRNPTVDSEFSLSDWIASWSTHSNAYAKPFQFLNLGILAYTGGDSALAQVTLIPNSEPLKGKGKIGNAVWRSVYLSKQVSWRNRLLVLNDWTKRRLFGRDITQL